MDVNIRPGEILPVTLQVDRPLVQVESQAVDFGEVLFDTSPNFRLNQTSFLPLAFVGDPFKLSAELTESSCANVSLTAGDPVEQDGRMILPLQLTSAGPVMPATCRGTVTLRGPNDDYDVTPAQIDWETRVASVEWSIVSGDLHLGDLQDAGGRAQATLLVRFNGKTPFVVQTTDLQGAGAVLGDDSGTSVMPIGREQIDVPAVEISGPPNEAGLYEVPLTLVARQAMPADQLRGSFYSGQLGLTIAGLPDAAQQVNFNFRSPSLYQRYLAPVVVPVYSMPWLLCTGPLSVLLLLVVVARLRGRGFDESEIEQAAVVATRQASANMSAPEPVVPLPSIHAPRPEVTWGSSEWGGAWSGGAEPSFPAQGATTGQTATGYANGSYRNGTGGTSAPSGGGDPWASSW
jgi:hypothetical protein